MLNMLRRALVTLVVLAILAGLRTAASAATASGAADYSGWRLPLAEGEWQISRGPCGSAARFTHDCRYYEERCAVDFVPLSGSMEDAPVLAPQAGQVFFLGARPDAGLMLMLLHPDGRVSGFMHLSKVVVGLDETVAQGQVVAYAGSTGSSGNPHLHFFVQPDAVQRECMDLTGLDILDFQLQRATSRNRAWPELTLPDPPAALPGFLPTLGIAAAITDVVFPGRLLLAPGATIRFPVAVRGPAAATRTLNLNGLILIPDSRTTGSATFSVPLTAPMKPGDYELTLRTNAGAQVKARYTVRFPPETSASLGLLILNPSYLSPNGWSSVDNVPVLCWTHSDKSAQRPLQFRVLVVGPTAADSGWITKTCWQTPKLKSGTYYWKVFVRDARGYMNRTNQRPYAFVVSWK
jgi:murein DD-endopeptidase MepM/ murein hydrolase activator NlpD